MTRHGRLLLFLGALGICALGALWYLNGLRLREPVELKVGGPTTSEQIRPSEEKRLEVPASAEDSKVQVLRAPRTEADAQRLEIAVVDPAGAAVAGATLVLFIGPEVILSATTDAEGLVRCDPGEGEAEFLLQARGWYAMRGRLETSAGRRSVVLAEGATIAGSVWLDGGAPAEPIELGFEPAAVRGPFVELPPAVAQALRAARGDQRALHTHSDDHAGFAFRGLPGDAAGSIDWKGPYFLEPDGKGNDRQSIHVPTPRDDLQLRLISGLELRLRVVDSFGAPVPGGQVALVTEFRSQGRRSSLRTTADEHGRFAKALPPQPPSSFTVSVALPDGSGSRSRELAFPVGQRGAWNVGDLACAAVRQLRVRVQDPSLAPVPGAIVVPGASTRTPDQRTDAQGSIEVALAEDEHEVGVRALGFLSQRVTVAPSDEQLVVTLERACALLLELPDFEGELDELNVTVSGQSPLLVDDRSKALPTQQVIGSNNSWEDEHGTRRLQFEADKDRRWKLFGLTPNREMRAWLSRAGGGSPLWEARIAPLAPGEQRALSMQLPGEAKSLRVRVVDSEQRPLFKASVTIIDPNGDSLRDYSTDAHGELELKSVFGNSVTVVASAARKAPKAFHFEPIPSEVALLPLDEGRAVDVELVDPSGASFTGEARVSATVLGEYSRGAPVDGQGRFRIERLPPGEVLIEASGDFGRASRVHDTSGAKARLVIGESCSVRARLQWDEPWRALPFAVAVALPGSSRDLSRVPLRSDAESPAALEISGLAEGSYEVWLLRGNPTVFGEWQRVGKPTQIVLGAEHESVEIELRP